jgi:bifunctional DNA-binding transcriptional regulator/antitoxin component of YhaV-PrlF toxin-antitoxin module
MKRLKITRGGQVSVPADIRRRWSTNTVAVEDRGDHVVLRPAPDDPVAAAYGAFSHLAKRPLPEIMAEYDEGERRAEARRPRSRRR